MADRHDLEHNQPGYEVRDVNAWAVGRFGIALVLLCICAVALLFGLFHYFESTFGGPLPNTGVNIDARSLPPAPTLQRTPVLDLQRFRAAEDQVLNSYSWVDRQHGIVHVPIDVAMDLLARRGLPARRQAPPADQADVPTASGLGLIMQQPGGPLASVLYGPPAPAASASPQSRDRKGAPAPPEKK
jgi:hypothetical protein